MSTNLYFSPQLLGFAPYAPGTNMTTLALNTAASGGFSATWLAYGFVPDQSKSINQFSARASAVAGTLAATDVQCDIYSDSAGVPGSSLVSSTNIGGTAPTAATWVRWSLTNTALTAGTQYWAVIRNANATPTTNSATFSYTASGGAPFWFGGYANGSAQYGWMTKTSTYSGGTWSNGGLDGGAHRIGWSDGTYSGFPIQSCAQSSTSQQAFGTGSNQIGVRFTVPAGVTLNCRGIAAYVLKSGSPTGNLVGNLWTGSSTATLVASTHSGPSDIPNEIFGQSSFKCWMPLFFSSAVALAAGTVVRATLSNTAADSAANSFGVVQYTMDSDANSTPLLPLSATFQGTLGASITAGNTVGSTATFTDQGSTPIIVPMGLLLDTAGEFGASGGILVHTGFNGGLNG
jgi:hypothetical protein